MSSNTSAAGKINTAAEQANTLLDQAGEAAGEVAGRAMAAMRVAGSAAENLYGQSGEARDYVVRMVRANPVPALLIAGAIGYALAAVVQRR